MPDISGPPAAGFDLTGKTALITGAGSISGGISIGRGCAMLLADYGAHVALLDSNPRAAEDTLSQVRNRGGSGAAYEVDVTDSAAVAEAATQPTGRLDIVVNNVGIVGPPGNATNVDETAWDEAFRTNVTSMITVPSTRPRSCSAAAVPSSILAP